MTRVWTIFEQYTAIRLGIPVRIIMPQKAAEKMVNQFYAGKQGITHVTDALCEVDCESSEASSAEDERKVKTQIRGSVGFAAVNLKIREFLMEWVAAELQARMRKLFASERISRASGVQREASRSTCCEV